MRALLVLVLLVVCGAAAPAHAADWQWPLSGGTPPSGATAVSRPFTAPAHRFAAGHRGADLPAAPGAPVLAAGDGVVSYAGLVAGRGVVAVVHGELRTTYEPVSAVVGVGQPVRAGEVLGSLEPGHAGCPGAACLHWGLRRGADYLDPVRLVAPGPVRLLPLDATAPAARAAVDGGPTAPVAAGVDGGPTARVAAAGRQVLTPGRGAAPAPAGPALPSAGPAGAGPAGAGMAAAAAVSVLGGAALVARRRR